MGVSVGAQDLEILGHHHRMIISVFNRSGQDPLGLVLAGGHLILGLLSPELKVENLNPPTAFQRYRRLQNVSY
jgi:hypothetical protein